MSIKASGSTKGLRRGEAATVATVVCVAVMGAEFFPGAELEVLPVFDLLAILVVLFFGHCVRTSVGGEEDFGAWAQRRFGHSLYTIQVT